MTPDPLDAALRPFLRESATLIDHRIADAARHGLAADIASAVQRIDELHGKLSGPGSLMERARRDFFRRSVRHHRRTMDSDILRVDIPVDVWRELEDIAASGSILGRDLAAESADNAGSSKRTMSVVHNAYGVDRPDMRAVAFKGWQDRQANLWKQWTKSVLTDTQMNIHYAAMHILIDPEKR